MPTNLQGVNTSRASYRFGILQHRKAIHRVICTGRRFLRAARAFGHEDSGMG